MADQIVSNEGMANFIIHVHSMRQELLKKLGLGEEQRDVAKACKYPQTLTVEMFSSLYERDPVAKRIVNILPKESWRVSPEVYEDENPEVETAFEKAFSELGVRLRGGSKFKSDKGNPIWEILMRADILSGIGDFAIILFGIEGVEDFEQPLEFNKTPKKLNYLQIYDRRNVKVLSVNQDMTSTRYGHPEMYQITFELPDSSGVSLVKKEVKVHWTHVVHIADNIESNEWSGVPRLQVPFNRTIDLGKIYGGSGEGYWQSAVPLLSIESNPALGTNVTFDEEGTRKQLDNVFSGFQRYLNLIGMTAKTVSPTVNDPTPHIKSVLDAICLEIGCPIRVFMGSERGDLASTTDDDTWDQRLQHRQDFYVTPRIVVPFVDRLILIGVLPEPESYSCTFNQEKKEDGLKKAQTAKTITEAAATYVREEVEALVTPTDFLTAFCGFSDEKAASIVKNASDVFDDDVDNPSTVMERKTPEQLKTESLPQGDVQKEESVNIGEDHA